MSPARWLELLTLVPAVIRLFRECGTGDPAELAKAAEERVRDAAQRALDRRRKGK